MTEKQIRMIQALQDGMPVSETPFSGVAEAAGVTEEELLDQLSEWKADGTIRRFGAILRHHQAGYSVNAMVVWDVPDEDVERFGLTASQFTAVSHCYQRPRFADLPYNLYTMIHRRTKEECEETVRGISGRTGITSYALLYTTKEYKKTSPAYFTDDSGV